MTSIMKFKKEYVTGMATIVGATSANTSFFFISSVIVNIVYFK